MTQTLHDQAKVATLNYMSSGQDMTLALRACYGENDFTGVTDALATYGMWGKEQASGDVGRRIAVLRTLLLRIGGENDGYQTVTIKTKKGEPLSLVVKVASAKVARMATFSAARKAVHAAISELASLKDVGGFQEFHQAALQALNALSAMPEIVEFETRAVSGVEMVGKV